VSSVDLEVVATDPAFAVVGTSFVRAPGGISTLSFGRREARRADAGEAAQRRSFGCGSGPTVTLDQQPYLTEVVASTAELMRGASVPFRVCGSDLNVLTGEVDHLVLASPSTLFRVDTLALQRQGAVSATTQPLVLTRDDRGLPTSVRVPERERPTLLTVPQNLNAGWVATLGGEELPVTRVDGWKQAWEVPAGDAGTVRLSYPPDTTFAWALAAGAVGLGIVVLVVLVPMLRRRATPRREMPALVGARPRLIDLVVGLAVPALLLGWWGLAAAGAAVVVAAVLREHFRGWPLLAGLCFLVGSAAMVWDNLTERTWAVEWTQAWSLAALVCLVAALVEGGVARRGGREPYGAMSGAAGTVVRSGSIRLKNRMFFARRKGRSRR
jgi:arabinofuranan 3-O-arabinosyltransferase